MQGRVDAAVADARNKVRKYKPLDAAGNKHTTCSALFVGYSSHPDGLTVLNSIIIRNGEGYTRAGDTPCAPGPDHAHAFWDPALGPRNPYVFVCNSFYGFGPDSAATFLIHEGLHVIGQTEDHSGSTGPGDAPTYDQIQAVVEAACYDPQIIE